MKTQPGFQPNVMTLGSGPRRALALHCTMAFGGAWQGFSKAMPELILTAPDMPSHGRSADWDGQSDFAQTVTDASLSALDVVHPVDVIGHSFGAVIALRLAMAFPEKIRSVTVIEPVLFVIARQDAPQTLVQHDVDAKPYLEAVAAGNQEAAARAFNAMWSDAPDWAEIPERNRAAMIRAIPVVADTHAFLYDDSAGIVPALPQIDLPVLVMRGENAHPAVIETNNGLAKRLPHAEQVVIPGAGHMAPITHPRAVAEKIAAFLPAV